MADAAPKTDDVPAPGGSDLMSDLNALTKDLATNKRQQIGEETQVVDQNLKTLEADRARMKTYFDREGVGPDDVKKWDADAERQKYSTNPLESFGSLASVFGIMASAFTKAPMANALNASAAAMNATRARDDEAYKRAFEAFKENMDLAIKRHQMMHEDYQDAVSLMGTDMQIGEAKLKQLATKYGDQQALLFLDHGYSTELFQMLDARQKAMQQLVVTNEMMTTTKLRDAVRNADPRWHSKNVDERLAAHLDSRSIGDIKSPDADMYSRLLAEANQHHDWTFDQRIEYVDKWYGTFNQSKWKGTGTDREKIAIAEDVHREHPDWSPGQVTLEVDRRVGDVKSPGSADERTIRARATEIVDEANKRGEKISEAQARLQATQELTERKTKKTLSQADLQTIEKKAGELKQEALDKGQILSDTEAYRQARMFVRGGGKTLTDEAASNMADLWISGEHDVFQNLGRGIQGSENVAKVREMIAKKITEQRITPDQIIRNVAEVKGMTSGEQTLFRRQANVISAAEAFEKVAPTVTAISDRIDRTKYPSINSILLAAQRGTGDEKVVRLAAAINGAINTYSRAISAGGTPYVNDKEHAREILDIAYSKGQMRAAIDQLTIEVNAELEAPGASKEVLYDMFRGAPALKLATQGSDQNQSAPPRRRQNGHLYEQQQDGTWKAVE